MAKLTLTPGTRTVREKTVEAAAAVFTRLHSFIDAMYRRQRGSSEFVERLRSVVLEETGESFSSGTMTKVEQAIFQAFLQHKPLLEGEPEYVNDKPQDEDPVVANHATIPIPALWAESYRYLGGVPFVLDRQIFDACRTHLQSLTPVEQQSYMPPHVEETTTQIETGGIPVYLHWSEAQRSGRGNEGGRGVGPMFNPKARWWFVFKHKFKVSKKAKRFYMVSLCLKYGLKGERDLDTWSKTILKLSDVSSKHEVEMLSHAKAWRDIQKSGKTNRGVEFDADTSGLVHLLMQWGQYSLHDIDNLHGKWRKLHMRMVARLKVYCPWMAGMSVKEILVWAKAITTPCMYGGGKRAITSQIFGVEWDHAKNSWMIPSDGLEIPTPWVNLMKDIECPNKALERFEKTVGTKYAQMFRSCFPFVSKINKAAVEWATKTPISERFVGMAGWRCPIVDYKELKKKMHPIYVENDGLDLKTNVSTLAESEHTDVLAKLIHGLDSYNMMLFVSRCKARGIPVRAIHDAVVIPIAFLEWGMLEFSRCFLETHRENHCPWSTPDWQSWAEKGHTHVPMVVSI